MPRLLSNSDVADFRERLCEVAERLFAEHGPDGVTMRQLASAMGVSPMTPYRYFRDKDDILAAVRAGGFTRFAEALEAAYATAGDPLAKLNAVGEAYVRFAHERPEAYRLMFDLAQPTEGSFPELVAASERARAALTRHVEALLGAGLVEGEPEMIAHILWANLHGALVLELAGKLPAGLDPAGLRRESFRALARGLGLKLPETR